MNMVHAFDYNRIFEILMSVVVVGLGVIVGRYLSLWTVRLIANRVSYHQEVLIKQILFFVVFSLFVLTALQNLGFEFNILLGATGIITVAVGFASQTSIANLVSGLFLLMEKPFSIGDTITIHEITGEILSIDILSVKLKTADNTLVRVPNETLIKTHFINLSHFPIRRLDFKLAIDYEDDMDAVKKLLLHVAKENPLCLADPKAAINFLDFHNTGISIQFSVWTLQKNYFDLKNSLAEEIKKSFWENKIKAPSFYPFYSGREVLPAKMAESSDKKL
jgi:small-conductance mechanosensitive channel